MDCIVKGVAESDMTERLADTVGSMGQKLSKRRQQAGLRTANQHSSARSSASYSRPVLNVSFLCLHSLWAMGKLPVLQNGLGFLYSHFFSSPLVGLFFLLCFFIWSSVPYLANNFHVFVYQRF